MILERSCEFLSNLVSLTLETTIFTIEENDFSCEFLSNLVSLTLETTAPLYLALAAPL